MIHLKMYGGLGNQLFIYAFGRWMEHVTGDKLQIHYAHRGSEAIREYGLDYLSVPERYHSTGSCYVPKMKHSVREALYLAILYSLKIIAHTLGWKHRDRIEKKLFHYLNRFGIYLLTSGYVKPYVKPRGVKIVDGYWQSDKYFMEVKELLQNELQVSTPPLTGNQELIGKLRSTQSVCVNIRRDDYFTMKGFLVCTPEYYYEAMKRMRERLPDCDFHIVSDDIQWIKDNMSFPYEVNYIDCSGKAHEDMRLMYSCRHFIMSNSTFSWWGQYLIDNPDKIVIAPKPWMDTDYYSEDIYQINWEVIEVQK